jgi:HD superfamily phosphodiesterase
MTLNLPEMNYSRLLSKIKAHVLKHYKKSTATKNSYHNQQHTEDVVAAAVQIANHYELDEHDTFIVAASAWFHDIGYLKNQEDHEQEGASQAEDFLRGNKLDEVAIELIKSCIIATKMPQTAVTLPEQILCDADLFHLGTKDFFKKDKLMHKESDRLNKQETSKLEWRKSSIVFLESHNYFTDYCQMLLNDQQNKNLEQLREKVAKVEEKKDETAKGIAGPLTGAIVESAEKKNKIRNNDKPEKGIETMFRVSSSNHQRLSDMADGKAHIMITVNSIILSAIISLVLRKLDTYGFLIVPTFILLAISLTAMTFAILSTRPSIPEGTFTSQQIEEKNVNLLFFGNFYKMPLSDFNEGMLKMMDDSSFLYGSLIRDLYAQGIVLGKKYFLLRISYNVFMFGLIISVAGFIITYVFFNHPVPPAIHPIK